MKQRVSIPKKYSIFIGVMVLAATLQTRPAHAQLTELYAFQYNAGTTSNYPDGQSPVAEFVQGKDGNYYTTTQAGGSGGCPSNFQGQTAGCGAIVKITPTGQLTVAYSFPYDTTNSTAPLGANPQAGLLEGPDGNFYGVTTGGGDEGASLCGDYGCGTIFKLTPAGALTVLHDFCGGNGCESLPTDGWLAAGRLAVGPDGNLYGTTEYGGLINGHYNQGTVFRVSLSGAYSVLHLFTGATGTGDGENPVAGLALGSDGNFYGTTEFGGTSGYGTIFKMNTAGTVTILHSFQQSPDGDEPMGALVLANDGNFYGTCYSGGANGWGTVFRISNSGAFQKIYDFTQGTDNVGYLPRAGLIQASDGNLYGTAWEGGEYDGGTIYQITLTGAATLEASFDPSATGFSPYGALVQGSDGKLYATLLNDGGSNGQGIQDAGAISVFNSNLPSPKPGILGFVPTSGKVGSKVTLGLGPYIGATTVEFNGVSAKFVIDGSELITAAVPSGATTGTISVTTGGGTTSSTRKFTVLP